MKKWQLSFNQRDAIKKLYNDTKSIKWFVNKNEKYVFNETRHNNGSSGELYLSSTMRSLFKRGFINLAKSNECHLTNKGIVFYNTFIIPDTKQVQS